jgi:hypothetical protein
MNAVTQDRSVGLGALPAGIRVVAARNCTHWLLAYAGGRTRVKVLGRGFSYAQVARALAGKSLVFFTYGSYLFAYDRGVIKVCADGMRFAQQGGVVVLVPPSARGVSGLGQIQTALPTTPGLSWWNYSWLYVGTDPGAAGVVPPGQPVSATGEVGKWVTIGSGVWGWYPPGTAGSPYGQVVGGDGNTYDEYSQSSVAASDVASGSGTSSFTPPPAGPSPYDPSASSLGSWVLTMPDYWAYVTSPADLAASSLGTSTTNVWLLGLVGLALVGGVVYLAVD